MTQCLNDLKASPIRESWYENILTRTAIHETQNPLPPQSPTHDDGTYFVTYCLHETISQPEIKQLIQKHQTHLEELRKQPQATPEQINIENRKYFKTLDEQIHQARGKHYLKNEEVAQINS